MKRLIRSYNRVFSAVDLSKKKKFVDAYMNAYDVSQSDALKIFNDCVNRGDNDYIDRMIEGFNQNAKKGFYED